MKIDINTWASECDYNTECTIYEKNKWGLQGLVSPILSHSLSLYLAHFSSSFLSFS